MTDFQRDDFVHRAETYARAGHHLHAVQLYKRILLARPDDVEVRRRLADVYASSGNITAAEKELLGGLRHAEARKDMLIALSRLFYQADLPKQAAYYLDQLIPYKSPEARFLQGAMAVRAGRYVDAERHLALALEYDPAMHPAESLLAEVCLQLGDTARAVIHSGRVYEQKKDDRDRQVRHARALVLNARYAEALDVLRGLPDSDPDVAILTSQCLLQTGDAIGARRTLTRAHDAAPDAVPVLLALAEVCLAQHDHVAARLHFDRVLTIDPENVQALHMTQLLHPKDA